MLTGSRDIREETKGNNNYKASTTISPQGTKYTMLDPSLTSYNVCLIENCPESEMALEWGSRCCPRHVAVGVPDTIMITGYYHDNRT